MPQTPKVAFIGGGSAMWGPLICRDLCASPELRGMEVRLHDIDPAAARRVPILCRSTPRPTRRRPARQSRHNTRRPSGNSR